MWMTSNFHAKGRVGIKGLVIFCAAVVVLSQTACVSVRGSDAPKKARKTKMIERPPAMDRSHLLKAVSLKNVKLQKMDPSDKTLTKLAGPNFLKKSTKPTIIEVIAAEPFPPSVGTSSPVIEINGVKLTDTVIHPDNNKILVAFLPDRKLLKSGRNVITVVWLGNENATRTKEPLILYHQGTTE